MLLGGDGRGEIREMPCEHRSRPSDQRNEGCLRGLSEIVPTWALDFGLLMLYSASFEIQNPAMVESTAQRPWMRSIPTELPLIKQPSDMRRADDSIPDTSASGNGIDVRIFREIVLP